MNFTTPDITALGGVMTVVGAGVGYFLNYLRQGRRDAYSQIQTSTQRLIDELNTTVQSQREHTFRLEGRMEQITLQLAQALSEGATNKAELTIALGRLELANGEISRLQGEVDEWERRWNTHFPKESL